MIGRGVTYWLIACGAMLPIFGGCGETHHSVDRDATAHSDPTSTDAGSVEDASTPSAGGRGGQGGGGQSGAGGRGGEPDTWDACVLGCGSDPGEAGGGDNVDAGDEDAGSDDHTPHGGGHGPEPLCGDGKLKTDEQCDDKNSVSDDGCSADCQIEPGWDCDLAGWPCHLDVPGDPDCVPSSTCRDGSTCVEQLSGLSCRCPADVEALPAYGELRLRSLGFLDDTDRWYALAISRDGSKVVGEGLRHSAGLSSHAVAWTLAGGTVSAATQADQGARAISANEDGSVVLVNAWPPGQTEEERDYEWTASGLQPIDLPTRALVVDVNADFSVLVGSLYVSTVNSYDAFRRTTGSDAVDIGRLEADFCGEPARANDVRCTSVFGNASAVSDDGNVVVGNSDWNGFRWTATDGMQRLPMPLPSGTFIFPGLIGPNCSANDVNADGSVIVGSYTSNDFGTSWAVRWTSAGIQDLGTLAPSRDTHDPIYDIARAVSADGSVIAGDSDKQAMIWDTTHGIRTLRNVLADAGTDVTAWMLTSATAISADGKVVAGDGVCEGRPVAFIARLP